MEPFNAHSVASRLLANRYFTNHGPLACLLEKQLADWFSIPHAVVVGSSDLGLLIALIGMKDFGYSRLIHERDKPVPKLLHAGAFCGLGVCSLAEMERLSTKEDFLFRTLGSLAALELNVGVSEWSQVWELEASWWLEQRPQTVLPSPLLITLPTLGGGAALLFKCGEAAERARNIRSSYGIQQTIPVFVTCNGRYSEAQAGAVLDFLNWQNR
ncbi:hypothetical protein [Marinobacter xestospongiae]|uniref:hypothetical protein n=1 Tax=Marinobacter xestospongiae TaxID=994319 RepID=UPI00200437CB|nr:hypothetical protein [Marinobacter xestospongiae]MCK7568869.1 hypothetical protein [Marinobacter xestospongiae]